MRSKEVRPDQTNQTSMTIHRTETMIQEGSSKDENHPLARAHGSLDRPKGRTSVTKGQTQEMTFPRIHLRKRERELTLVLVPSSNEVVLQSKRTEGKNKTRAGPKRRKGEEEGGKREKKRKAGPEKTRKPPPRHPRHPKTLRQSLPDRAKTVRLDNRNNSTKWLQNKIRALSQKPSEHKP